MPEFDYSDNLSVIGFQISICKVTIRQVKLQ